MRKNRNTVVAIISLGLALLIFSCATTGTQMSLKGKAAMMLSTYNSQTQQTLIMSQRTDLTEAQKVVVRKKKAIIMKLDPLIKAYGTLVQSGGIPSPSDEQAIYTLIDELVGG